MINLAAPINTTSYGIVGYYINKFFEEYNGTGIEHSLFVLPNKNHISGYNNLEIVNKALERAKRYSRDNIGLKLWHQHSLEMFPISKAYHGYTIFELDELTEQEKHNILNLDKIIVPSQWAASIISHKNIAVQPIGVDTNIFGYNPLDSKLHSSTYKFLHIGKYERRKSHDEIVKCFNDVFEPSDDVSLILHVNNSFCPDQTHAFKQRSLASKMGKKIMFINGNISNQKLAELYNSCHCYLAPSKAEGWNMPLLEALACGLPAIASDCTAHTEYCTAENSTLIPSLLKEKANDGIFFHGKCGSWHLPNWDSFKDALKHHYKENIRDNHKGIQTGKQYSWNSILELKNFL